MFDIVEPIVYVSQEEDVWYFILYPLLAMFSFTKAFLLFSTDQITDLVYLRLMFCDCYSAILSIMTNPPSSCDIWLNPLVTKYLAGKL